MLWLVMLSAFMPSAHAQDEELVRLYTEAQSAEAAGDYPGATKRYEQIVVLRPDLAEAFANLGNLYYVQGRREEASTAFQKAIRLKPSLVAPHLLLGVIQFDAGNFDLAQQQLTAALKLDPSNAMGALYLGYTYYALGRHRESARLLHKAVQQDPANSDAWYHLSKVNGQLSKQYFEILQKRFPDAVETYLARSHFHESAANWEQARDELGKALAKQPSNERLKQRMEWLQRRMAGDQSPPPAGEDPADGSTRYLHVPPAGQAIRSALDAEDLAVRASLKVTPQTPQSLYQLAEGYQALAFLSSLWVLESDADSYRAHQLKAQFYEAAGRLEDAVKEYREVLALKPDLRTIHFSIGNLYWRNARLDDARPELEAELKLNPRDAQAHYELGDILFSGSNSDEAEKHYEEAVRYAPSMAEAHLALERIANAKGNFEKALMHLKKAAAISPDDSAPHYRMWLLYRRMGKTAEAQAARAAFEKLKKQAGAAPDSN